MKTKDNSPERRALANRVHNLRIDCGNTQEQFAEILGISVSALKKIESGENQISIESLRRLENKLNVSADYLIFGKKADAHELWRDILNCTESDKFFLMMRLVYYFTNIKKLTYCESKIQKKYDQNILQIMELIYNEEGNHIWETF